MNKMKKSQSNIKKRGFTLIELLTVIAIIGILATIVIPGTNKVLIKAKRTKAMANVKNVVSAFNQASILEGEVITGVNTTNDWAVELAAAGGLNDGSMYYIDKGPEGMNKAIVDKQKKPVRDGIVNASGKDAPHYDVVVDMPVTLSDTANIPIIWTKGINARNGKTWSELAPWGADGGHVGFLGGNVEWMESTEDKLINYNSMSKESSLQSALPKSCKVVSPKGGSRRSAGGGSAGGSDRKLFKSTGERGISAPK